MKKQKKIIISIILFLIIVLSNCQVFATSILDYAKEIEYSERYLQYLDLKDVENMYEGKELKKVNGHVLLKNVDFYYGEKQILKKINISIKENSKIALVGETGSGKSTIIKLIAGLIKPQSGVVEIDGKDLSKLRLDSYYDYVSYLSQDSPTIEIGVTAILLLTIGIE